MKKIQKDKIQKQEKGKTKPKKVVSAKSKFPVRFSILVILLVTIIAYSPVFKAEFTNWDDQGYVTENPVIKNLDSGNFKLIFTENIVANYHPFTMLSLAIDYAIAGESSTWFHVINLLLHLLNTFLVFYFVLLLFRKTEINFSSELALLVAALFAVHTLHVESVAWIAERKDVLYSMFFLSSLISYVKYLNSGKAKFFIYSLLLFTFSLLSKGQAVSLAISLFAIDFLFRRKILSVKVILEKLPFLALAIVFGILALNAQQEGEAVAQITHEHVSFIERLMFASYGYVVYHIKLLLPLNLSAIYPYPPKTNESFPIIFYLSIIPALAILSSIFFLLKKTRILAFALLFFLVNIVLVLQIIPVGSAIIADRYVYISSIGFFILIAVLFGKILEKGKNKFNMIFTLAGVYLLILTVMTFNRSQVWENSMTLWNDVIDKHKNVQVAWNNRGNLYYKSGNLKLAMNDYSQAIKIQSSHPEAYMNRGTVKHDLKDFRGALADYNKSLEIDPNYASAYYGRGGTYLSLSRFKDAVRDYDMAIELNPNYAKAYSNRANVKMNQKRLPEAIEDYNKAIALNPTFADAYSNRGIAHVVSGNFEAAIKDYSMAIKLNPSDGLTLYLRGMAYISTRNSQLACSDFMKSAKLGFQGAAQKVKEYCK
ncbi:MAG: tetratricopeptide repeat protein [Bacteroidota bacterium]|nr:tetratricopeptide repeat protein [Bacteroidota bacterium]